MSLSSYIQLDIKIIDIKLESYQVLKFGNKLYILALKYYN